MVKSKYYCDRCGAEDIGLFEVVCQSNKMFNREKFELRNICKKCYEEFWEFVENYFDDVNMEEGAE